MFQDWQNEYNCRIVQIICRTDVDVLAQRYFDRQISGNRHQGHLDTGTPEEYRANFVERVKNGEDQPLTVDGPAYTIDTTNFKDVKVDTIVEWVKSHMEQAS